MGPRPRELFFPSRGIFLLTGINRAFIFINMKDKPYMTLTEAAEHLGLTRQRVHVFIQDGRLKVVNRIGGLKVILLDRAEVKRFKRERDKKAKK